MTIKRIFTVLLAALMAFSVMTFGASAATEKKLGDINGDGKINSVDYTMVKKHVLKTYKMNDDQLSRADINNDKKINSVDYTMVKKHVLKTYVIGGTTQPKTPVEKIVSAIGNRKEISIKYSGTIGAYQGDATISFAVVGGVLNLRGHAVTKEGMVIDMVLPLSKVSSSYKFNGTASLVAGTQTIEGKFNGKLNSGTYSFDDMEFAEISFTATIPLNAAQEVILETNCKQAMDQFLYQANLLLTKEKTGVNIGDLGFTQYQKEIDNGWVIF